jgi:hypothetical protein
MVLVSFVPQHNFTASHRREKQGLGYGYTLVHTDSVTGEIKTAMDVRYYDKGIRYYACVWLNTAYFSASGSDFVDGSGLCYRFQYKTSAILKALKKAGIEIEIDSDGNQVVPEMLMLIAKHLKLNKPSIITQYA